MWKLGRTQPRALDVRASLGRCVSARVLTLCLEDQQGMAFLTRVCYRMGSAGLGRELVEGRPRTMAADRDLEIEDVTLHLDGDMKGELEEEKEMREDGGGKDPFKNKKVHRVVSKWMLPEKVRRTYLERANCLPPPVFIISISIAELAVFIYYAVWKPQKQWITLDTGILESPFIYSPEKREEAWRFISYMLVHAGVQHILGNLVMQLMLGIPLEMVHKGLRVGLVYLAGVIAGSLASSIFDPLRYLVGASGGVYALMGGYFMNVLVLCRIWDLLSTEGSLSLQMGHRCLLQPTLRVDSLECP
ncbi:rhomboid-related protein 2 isoform X3 [Prionailurus viverrinus]|uniref:rhomboid-related protein 2 isoform X3 n=1 Tax=Prionailurus viverrinus TaxID=61388 RepID=UPI001FF5E489|nr:rhomboid-related protein 2 isoform X3 [Prionailurus viverrinus]